MMNMINLCQEEVFFTIPWVEAPSVTTARDGLGALLMQILVFLVILQMEEIYLIKWIEYQNL